MFFIKKVSLTLVFSMIFCLFSGCFAPASTQSDPSTPSVSSNISSVISSFDTSSKEDPDTDLSEAVSFRAVWIQYTDSLFSRTDREKYIATITEEFDNIKQSGFNAVILHVRANADAMYDSSLFPYSSMLTGTQGKDPGFDPLAIAVEEAHNRGLELHAWVNPYRVSAQSSDINKLSSNNPARIWKTDDDPSNDSYVIPWQNKLYFNPSCEEVQKLIIDGVREILDNYEVDGIHFDDYFYPVSDAEFDIGSYVAYCKATEYPLSQGDWRRTNVDSLVSQVYRLTKSYGKEFGISPAAPISKDNTDRNYTQYFINVKKWMSNNGYIDYIAPQLYFGYEHKLTDTRFDVLLAAWTSVKRAVGVELYIGLAAYKIGLVGNLDLDEWNTKTDILARQFSDCKKANADGIVIYNYSSFFSKETLNTQQRENLISQMNGE